MKIASGQISILDQPYTIWTFCQIRLNRLVEQVYYISMGSKEDESPSLYAFNQHKLITQIFVPCKFLKLLITVQYLSLFLKVNCSRGKLMLYEQWNVTPCYFLSYFLCLTVIIFVANSQQLHFFFR